MSVEPTPAARARDLYVYPHDRHPHPQSDRTVPQVLVQVYDARRIGVDTEMKDVTVDRYVFLDMLAQMLEVTILDHGRRYTPDRADATARAQAGWSLERQEPKP